MGLKEKQQSRFPATSWSTLARAGSEDPGLREAAVDDVVRRYLPALRSYLVEVRRVPADEADDVLQGFVADKVLRGGLLQKADPARGRFRNLLLRALENYLAGQRGRWARLPIPMAEEALPERSVRPTQADVFDLNWAEQVVRGALTGMRGECESKGRPDLWELFDSRAVRPAFGGLTPPSYKDLVERFGITSPRDAMNLFLTAKRMFNRHLQVEVARYEDAEQSVDEEINDLRSILLGTSAAPEWHEAEAGD